MGDAPALFALIQAAYRGDDGWTSEAGLIEGERVALDELRLKIAGPGSVLMVVPDAAGILACAEVQPGGAGVARFGLFAVQPSRQGSGVGRRLLALARRLADERFGAAELEISVVSGRPELLAWYERLGFAATGVTVPFPDDPRDRPLVDGLHFILMRCHTRPVPYALSWSGGKDSALALHALTAHGEPPPAALITTITDGVDRISMHGVRHQLLLAQTAALGVGLCEVRIPLAASNELYERRMAEALARPPLDVIAEIAFGDLFLADIRAYRETRCAGTGRRARFPLWLRDTTALAHRFLALGFRARITCVDPDRLDPSFAGRAYDERLLEQLPRDVDPCGENGEFHTFVHDGPGFAAPVACRPGEVVRRDGFVFADLVPV